MTDVQIAAVDSGNGGTNAIVDEKVVYFPSVRAAASGDSLGLGKDWELQYDFVDWGGHRYVYGDDVTRVTKRGLERHIGVNRYGNEFHRFLVAVALGKLGIKTGKVDLTLFAPPGLYATVRKNIQDWFMRDGGMVGIHFKGEKKPRIWQYSKISVFPEGLAALAALIFDDHGKPVNADAYSGSVVLLDSGVFTLDAVQVSNGNFNPETLEHATWQDGGLNVHLREPILKVVKDSDTNGDFTNCTVDDIDVALRAKNRVLVAGSSQIDLTPIITKYAERYAEWVANNVIDPQLSGLRGFKTCVLVGGGAELIEPYLKKWYGDKIFDRRKDPIAKKLHPAYLNVWGGYKLARARLGV